MTHYIVWNHDKTCGFVTDDKQLAYEVRKSSETNCSYKDGGRCLTASAFCEEFGNKNCTMEELTIEENVLKKSENFNNTKALSDLDTISKARYYYEDGVEIVGIDFKEEISIIRAALQRNDVPQEIDGLKERIEELSDDGFWHNCSGCLESEDGHHVGHYPYSNIFKCYVGSGCSECGGLGVVWDNCDYEQMAKDMMHDAAAPKPTGE